jgi:hypothetical protein
VANFLELLLASGGRPASAVGRFVRAAAKHLPRPRRKGDGPISASTLSNRLRRDIGLPPVDSHDLPL